MAEQETRSWRFFGADKLTLSERLGDILTLPDTTAALTADDLDITLTLTAAPPVLEETDAALTERLGRYLYSRDGTDLAHRVVALLEEKQRTLAVAESCTGGMVASRLTDVPGCSQVFGTGVVSYSRDCKAQLLGVRRETLSRYGAVSEQTAGEMARGVRSHSGAALGLSITGEAGPKASEEHPVGTVYIALADGKRTWVQEWQFGNGSRDRTAIRRAAAGAALDLVRRYLEAYPTVIAGGISDEELPPVKRQERGWRRLLVTIFPSKDESRRIRWVKRLAWLAALLLVLGSICWSYLASQASRSNQSLQERLGKLYWSIDAVSGDADGAAETAADGRYPTGMDARFRSLYDSNPDVAGWIRIPDTDINFPVMAYTVGYYENHSFSGQYSPYGQPYFDERTVLSAQTLPRSLTIYGKYDRDNQMLTPLQAYRRLAYLNEHPVIEMNTLFVSARWEIFAVLVVDETEDFDYARTEFTDDTDFEAHLVALQKRALFRSGTPVTTTDRILLVSVDARNLYGHAGARLVVAARQTTQDRSTANFTFNYQAQMPESWAEKKDSSATSVGNSAGASGSSPTTTEEALTDAGVSSTTTTTTTVTTTTTTTAVPEESTPAESGENGSEETGSAKENNEDWDEP